jgi:hypothetical protein
MRNFVFGTTSASSPAGGALSALAALVLLAGCSGGSATPPLAHLSAQSAFSGQSAFAAQSLVLGAQHPEIAALPGAYAKAMENRTHQPQRSFSSRIRPDVLFPATGTVWVTDAGNNSVYRCTNATNGCVAQQVPAFGSPLATWNEPQGIAADSAKDVYIADTVNSRIVELDPTGATVLGIYADPNEYPVGVAVAVEHNIICVTNMISTSGGPGNIVCYKQGHFTGPNWTAGGLMNDYYFDGFDKAGNLYVDGFDSNGVAEVEEVPHAASGGTTEVLSPITIQFPGGVEVERTRGYLLVDDQSARTINQYVLPGYGAGTPASFTMTGASDPVSFGLKPGDLNLWMADAGIAEADAYHVSAGGPPAFRLPWQLPVNQPGLFSVPIGAVYTAYGQF